MNWRDRKAEATEEIGDNLADERTLVPMGEIGEKEIQKDKAFDPEHMIDLKKPIMIGGKKVSRLEFDFDALTANDLHKASKYLKNLGIPVSVAALDLDYQLVVFGKAVKKCMDDVELSEIMRLSASDTTKVTGLAQNFLLGKDPEQKDFGSEES